MVAPSTAPALPSLSLSTASPRPTAVLGWVTDVPAVPGSSLPSLPLQGLSGRGLLAIVVTFVLLSAFYAVTLHLAATFYIGAVPSQRAATVGPVPAAVSLVLQRYGLAGTTPFGLDPSLLVGVVILVTLLADLLAISFVYRLTVGSAVPLVLLHFAFAAVLGIALANVFGLL